MDRELVEGISYGSALKEIDRLIYALDRRRFGIVEAPITSINEYLNIYHICKERGVKVSLHVPSPELVQKYPFLLHISSPNEIDQYVEYITDFVEQIPLPEYVLVHFPMFTDKVGTIVDRELDLYFTKQIHQIAKQHKFKLYFENVAIKDSLCMAKDYLPYMEYIDGIVFDCGHAHSISCFLQQEIDNDPVEDFFELMGKHIKGIHLYNTVNRPTISYNEDLYIGGVHYPFVNKYDGIDGFMNRNKIIKSIQNLPNLEWIIYEPDLQFIYNETDYGEIYN